MTKYTIHTDGGSRGNPGPAASGYVIEGDGISAIHHGQYLGVATNNVAEYTAAILGLDHLRESLGADRALQAQVEVMSDSELLVRQVNGQYKVKDATLKKLFSDLYHAQQGFAKVVFSHVRREQNTAADRMVNEALDEHERSQYGSR